MYLKGDNHGKTNRILEYERVEAKAVAPKERIKNFNEFHTPLSEAEQRCQSARCMDCGVPFCQSGMTIKGMTSGCPLNNLIPEWNDLVYTGNWEQAYNRLHKTSNFPEFTSRVCPALCEKHVHAVLMVMQYVRRKMRWLL